MNTASITATTDSKPRMRGFALISVIAALMLTLFLEALDQTIVGTALPRIIEELHSLDRYSWVVTAYILATMTMIPIVGKLSDQFGRKWFCSQAPRCSCWVLYWRAPPRAWIN